MDLKAKLIQDLFKNKTLSPAVLALEKRRFAKKYRLPCPKNSALLKTYHDLIKQKRGRENKILEQLLRTREIRSLSGIVSISVLTKPWPCPGHCLYCPTVRGLPKSYLQGEPAVMRAMANKFDPYNQVRARLTALKAIGHQTNKIELIIIGGTWSFLPSKYQDWFVKECFRATNNYGTNSKPRIRESLLKEQKRNENAEHRIIGITIETRPDFIDENEVKRLRELGITRVELGVQSVFDNVLKRNLRGHTVKETIEATKLLKNAGFKVCYHIMPNLPGSDLKLDEKCFNELFANPNFQPDFLKIYPCVVVKQAPLYRLWSKGQYQSYSDRRLINLLVKVKQKIPYYCRVIRIYRDIPSPQIMAGSKISNLRQVIAKELKKQGKKCLCIRCREIKNDFSPKQNLKLFRQDYVASGGKEIFLSYEDKKRRKLYALLRLRLKLWETGSPAIFPVLKNSAIIREVHTYGQTIGFSEKSTTSPQHRSLGKNLIKTAEKIAQDSDFQKIAVISGIGARNYYRRLGYRLQNTYLVKNLI
jgi:elongator complex protein 3